MQAPSWVGDAFERARNRLGADVLYYVEFVGDEAVVGLVAGEGAGFGVYRGLSMPVDATFAPLVARAKHPVVVPDTSAEPSTQRLLAEAGSAPRGFVGVPVRLANGRIFAVLCAIFADPRPAMSRPDAAPLVFLADVVAVELARLRDMRELEGELRTRTRRAITEGALRCVFQPIVDLRTRRTIGVEALTRFDLDPPRPPATWFAEAHRVGVGIELEIAAVQTAARAVRGLPDHVYVSVNATPSALRSPEFFAALDDLNVSNLVIEVTEHAAVSSYAQVFDALADVRAAGCRLAIDDLGSGFAGLNHLTGLQPDIIKIDGSVVRRAVPRSVHRSLLVGMVAFAADTGAQVVAEGVERAEHLEALVDAGVHAAQGFALAPPGPARAVRTTYGDDVAVGLFGEPGEPRLEESREDEVTR